MSETMQAPATHNFTLSISRWISRLRPWRELAVAASILMELSWAVLWYRLMILPGRQASYPQVFVILGSMLALVYLLSRYMHEMEIDSLLRRGALLGILLLNLLVGLEMLLYAGEFVGPLELIRRPIEAFRSEEIVVPVEFVFILLIVLVSWRGITFSAANIGPSEVLGRFRLGVFMLFLYGLILPLLEAGSAMALYMFLFFSLMAMSAARISMLNRVRGGRVNRLNRQWLIGITAVILSIVGASALVVSMVGNRLFEYLANLVTWSIYIFVLVISPIMYVLMRAIFFLARLLQIEALFKMLQELIRNVREVFDSLVAAMQRWFGTLDRDALRSFLLELARTKPYILWAVVILVVLLVVLSIRRHAKRDEIYEEEDIESLLDEQDLFGLMRRALRKGWNRFAERLGDLLNLSSARKLLAAARIRRIYAGLMDLSAKLERPRPQSRTPLEFLPSLIDLFPNRAQDLNVITQAYLSVRYGELPETLEEVEKVEDAWRRVRMVAKETIRQRT